MLITCYFVLKATVRTLVQKCARRRKRHAAAAREVLSHALSFRAASWHNPLGRNASGCQAAAFRRPAASSAVSRGLNKGIPSPRPENAPSRGRNRAEESSKNSCDRRALLLDRFLHCKPPRTKHKTPSKAMLLISLIRYALAPRNYRLTAALTRVYVVGKHLVGRACCEQLANYLPDPWLRESSGVRDRKLIQFTFSD